MTSLKSKIQELKSLRGHGTQLISLYIVPRKQISDVTSQLREEYGQASNIKSKTTQDNVRAAIQSCIARLKLFSVSPNNGLVLFCGRSRYIGLVLI